MWGSAWRVPRSSGGEPGVASIGLLVAAAVLVGPVLWVVSDQYLEATHYGGTRIRLAWDGVEEVQHFVVGARVLVTVVAALAAGGATARKSGRRTPPYFGSERGAWAATVGRNSGAGTAGL